LPATTELRSAAAAPDWLGVSSGRRGREASPSTYAGRVAGPRDVKRAPSRLWRALPHAVRSALSQVWELISRTVGICIRYRVTGLAAEGAFFAILSLPPLIFGLVGAVGFVAQRYDVATLTNFREQALALSSRALTPDAVATVIEPTLDDVLSGGRFEIISIGFLLALWSGSRSLNVFVDTITIMYGLSGQRGLLRTRALSFVLYLVFLVVGIIVLPLVLAGPGLVDALLPDRFSAIALLYWPVVLVGTACFLAGLYHLSVPVRTRWLSEIPGAALTLLIWLGGSWLLRVILVASAGSTTIYGPLAAPIAVLIWLFVTSLAVLIGAAFNAAIDYVWPRLSGIDHTQTAYVDSSVPPSSPRLTEVLTGEAADHPVQARAEAREQSRTGSDSLT
jgi:membrane protein